MIFNLPILSPCISQGGIYEITNLETNQRYIGQTSNFNKRWRQHENSLIKKTHKNKHLLNSFNHHFNRLGHSNFFRFDILEMTDTSSGKEERLFLEEKWINKRIDENIELYNTHLKPTVQEPKQISSGFKLSQKTRDLLSQIRKGKPSRFKGKTYEETYGPEKAAEIKKKISENKLIEMNRPEVKENLRQQLQGKTEIERYGADKAQLVKEKKRLARKGKYTGKDSSGFRVIENISLRSPTGEIFSRIEGIKEFADKFSLSPHHLSEIISRKRKSHHGWKLI